MSTKRERDNTTPVRVASLRIRNILGIEQVEVRPGSVTLVEGRNGEGKTSILEAFKAVLSGGQDATLLRNGAASGEIVLVLDDGTQIEKTVTAERSDLKVRHAEFGKLPQPRTYINRLLDSFSLNPVDFLLAKKDKQLELLLEAIPLHVRPADLAGITDLCSMDLDFDKHALQVLAAVGKDLYDQRTGYNRSAKERRTAAAEMKKALPAEATAGNAQEALRDAKAEQATFLNHINSESERINRSADETRAEERRAFETRRDALIKERDVEIEAIRTHYQGLLDAAGQKLNTQLDSVAKAQQHEHEKLAKERQVRTDELAKKVAAAEAAMQTFIHAAAAREHVTKLEEGAATNERKSRDLTEAIDELETIKAALVEKLPIRGLEIRGTDIYIDGVAFERVNEARRVRMAIELAMLRAGSLPLLCCDGIERLDSASLEALENVAKENGVQLVMARVTDSDLAVKVIA